MVSHSGEYLAIKTECIDPYMTNNECNVSEYAAIVKDKNELARVDISNAIKARNPDLNNGSRNFILAEFGSGGRSERGIDSRMDLNIIGDQQIIEVAEYIRNKFPSWVREVSIHVLGQDSVVFLDGNPSNSRPSRAYDSKIFYGSNIDDVSRSFHDQLINEVKQNGKKISRKLKDHARNTKNITKNKGLQRYKGLDKQHFDLDAAKMYYNPGESIGSFKYGPLRYVQFSIARGITSVIKSYDHPQAFLSQLPKNTVERLQFFESEGLLNINYLNQTELSELYEYFLWLFHISQYRYHISQQVETEVEIPDAKLTAENLNKLLQILENGIFQLS